MFRNVYERMSRNVVEIEGATNDVTIWRIRVACWISRAICTYAHARARVPTCTHARARARKHAHTDP